MTVSVPDLYTTTPATAPAVATADTPPPTPPLTPPLVFQHWETLSLLVHAGSKIGKSSLAATAPAPILVLDAEGSWKFIPARKRYWDPRTEYPPQYDGTWDICVVNVSEWQTVQLIQQWVTQYPVQFATICVDSVTELQRRAKQNLNGTEALKIQDWGVLLNIMDSTIRGFRDLILMRQLPFRCAVFVAETREGQNGKWRPMMQGQIEVALPYWMDLVGYLYPDFEADGNGQPTVEVRRLLITPHPQFEAGERVQGRLGRFVTIPRPPDGQVGHSIQDMMLTLYGPRPAA